MLAILSMIGGKTIGKYVIIAGVVAAIAFGMWLAVQSYNKAITDNAKKDLQLSQANSEVEQSNADKKQMAGIIAAERERTRAAQQLAHQRAISRQQATAALAGYLNSNSSADINRMLCDAAARIQGSPVAGCGKEVLATGSARAESDHSASYVITDSTVEAIHSALIQCGDYIVMSNESSP